MIASKADGAAPIYAWTEGVDFADNARAQVENIAKLPFVFHHVAVMPDVHYGIGATVGSVIATKGAVIPAAVGVDLGCGMTAVRTNLSANDLPDDLGPLRSEIESRIPHGRTNNGGPGDRGAWGDLPQAVLDANDPLQNRLADIVAKHPSIVRHPGTVSAHLGTLGTGNHFVEVCLDEEQRVWIMLHSGSRGIGNRIGSYFIEKAKAQAAEFFYEQFLPDKDLAYLVDGTPIFKDYVEAVLWAQDYASTNRSLIMDAALAAVATIGRPIETSDDVVSCHHNYLARERHFGSDVIVTRKGAVRAREGDRGIIPGSMGAKSFIVVGKGNRDSFTSCSHGAGRRLGRNEAKRQITMADFERQIEGVECRHDQDVIDEAPAAYKSIDDVMAAQRDLVDVQYTLKQVLCVKG